MTQIKASFKLSKDINNLHEGDMSQESGGEQNSRIYTEESARKFLEDVLQNWDHYANGEYIESTKNEVQYIVEDLGVEVLSEMLISDKAYVGAIAEALGLADLASKLEPGKNKKDPEEKLVEAQQWLDRAAQHGIESELYGKYKEYIGNWLGSVQEKKFAQLKPSAEIKDPKFKSFGAIAMNLGEKTFGQKLAAAAAPKRGPVRAAPVPPTPQHSAEAASSDIALGPKPAGAGKKKVRFAEEPISEFEKNKAKIASLLGDVRGGSDDTTTSVSRRASTSAPNIGSARNALENKFGGGASSSSSEGPNAPPPAPPVIKSVEDCKEFLMDWAAVRKAIRDEIILEKPKNLDQRQKSLRSWLEGDGKEHLSEVSLLTCDGLKISSILGDAIMASDLEAKSKFSTNTLIQLELPQERLIVTDQIGKEARDREVAAVKESEEKEKIQACVKALKGAVIAPKGMIGRTKLNNEAVLKAKDGLTTEQLALVAKNLGDDISKSAKAALTKALQQPSGKENQKPKQRWGLGKNQKTP